MNNNALKDLNVGIPKLNSLNIGYRGKVAGLEDKKRDNEELIQARKDFLFT